MPWTGQDKTANASKRGLEQSAATRRLVANGEKTRINPENSASARGLQRRSSTSEAIRSGRYFGENTALKKQAEANQRGIAKTMEFLQSFKS